MSLLRKVKKKNKSQKHQDAKNPKAKSKNSGIRSPKTEV